MGSENGRILYESRIGKTKIGIQLGEREAAFSQRFAVAPVLLNHAIELRPSERNRSKPSIEVASWYTNNGVGEQAAGPLCA